MLSLSNAHISREKKETQNTFKSKILLISDKFLLPSKETRPQVDKYLSGKLNIF